MLHTPSKFSLALAAIVLVVAPGLMASQAAANEPYLGQIQQFGFNFAPNGWAFCDGQILSIAQNTALFSLLGTTFGGDGRATFALPDLRGRVAVHPGSGPGLSPVTWGERDGAETVTLQVANLPPRSLTGGEGKHSVAAPEVEMKPGGIAVGNSGSGLAFRIRNPYLGIYHCIALAGIFPSRG